MEYGPQRPRLDGAMDENNLVEEMEKVPLFRSSQVEDVGENPTLLALQSLVHDGTPNEIAQNFKEQGNEAYQEKRWRDAIHFYTQAIETKCDDNAINEACYANRAAANLEIENYGVAIKDCSMALQINPKSIKALYRISKARLALDKVEEAINSCEHGLTIDTNNAALIALKKQIEKRKQVLDEKRQKITEKKNKEAAQKEALLNAIKKRKIKMEITDPDWMTSNPQCVYLDPENHTLAWPVVFAYPEYQESDFIQAFNELTTFADHIKVMLGTWAPWDKWREYAPNKVDVYFETFQDDKSGLVKLGKKCTLYDALTHSRYVVHNGVPTFVVLQKKGKFLDEYLAKFQKLAEIR